MNTGWVWQAFVVFKYKIMLKLSKQMNINRHGQWKINAGPMEELSVVLWYDS